VITITLPWHDRKLSPNARVHHFVLARAKKKAKSDANILAFLAYREIGRPQLIAPITVSITFHPPDNRRRDLDNMLASNKAALDGIAAAIGVDDSLWRLSLSRGDVVKSGKVVVQITPAAVSVPVVGQVS